MTTRRCDSAGGGRVVDDFEEVDETTFEAGVRNQPEGRYATVEKLRGSHLSSVYVHRPLHRAVDDADEPPRLRQFRPPTV